MKNILILFISLMLFSCSSGNTDAELPGEVKQSVYLQVSEENTMLSRSWSLASNHSELVEGSNSALYLFYSKSGNQLCSIYRRSR